MRGVLLVDTNLSRPFEMPAHDWIRQEFFLEGDSKLKRQIYIENRNIQRRRVISRIYMRPGSVNLVEAGHLYRGEDRVHDQPRPGSRKPMLAAIGRATSELQPHSFLSD